MRAWARVRPVDPLLVITNGDAGTADDEALEAALAILRESCSVEVQATSQARASSTASSSVRRRGGSWSRAATAACTRWSPRSTAGTT